MTEEQEQTTLTPGPPDEEETEQLGHIDFKLHQLNGLAHEGLELVKVYLDILARMPLIHCHRDARKAYRKLCQKSDEYQKEARDE